MAVKHPVPGQLVYDTRSGRKRIIREVYGGRAYIEGLNSEYTGWFGVRLSPAGSLLRHIPLTEPYTDGTGQFMLVHAGEQCTGVYCPIHNPSDHSMRDFPTHYRFDRGIMERICPHGVGHPDPDDRSDDGVHGCDGCCS